MDQTTTKSELKSGVFKWTASIYNRLFPAANRPVFFLSLTATGLFMVTSYKIVENYFITTNPLYAAGVKYLHNNEIVRDVIGHPIKLKTMKNLLKLKEDFRSQDKIVMNVDFKGKLNSGILTIYGRKNDSDEWELKKVEVKLKKEYYYKNLILFRNETFEEADTFVEVL